MDRIKPLGFLVTIAVIAGIACSSRSPVETAAQAMQRGEYAKAIKPLQQALAQDSLDLAARYGLTLTYAHLDSAQAASRHYVRLVEQGSAYSDSTELKVMLCALLQIEPFPTSPVPMGKLNQFKASPAPDGQVLAVAAARYDRADIYLVRIDGTVVKRLTNAHMNTDPCFSPLGDKIVYVSNRDGDEELYLYDLKSETTEQLTDNTYTDYTPAFAPSGQEIVYSSNRDGSWEIYRIDLERHLAFRLTENRFWDGFPAYTPDGRSIVFASKRNGSEDVYIMKTDGRDEQPLYATAADETDPQAAGEYLYFRSDRSGDWEIYRYHFARRSLVRLTCNALPDWNPRISRDGTRLFVTRPVRGRWSLFFVNLQAPVPAAVIAQTARTRFGLPEGTRP